MKTKQSRRDFLKKSISAGALLGFPTIIPANFTEDSVLLIEEAKSLKQVSGKRTIDVRRGELSQLAKKAKATALDSFAAAAKEKLALKETIDLSTDADVILSIMKRTILKRL